MSLVRAADQLTDVDISRIAREIARDLKPLQMVLDTYNIDLDAFDRIQRSELFQQRLIEEAALWMGTTKTGLRERVSTKAAIAIDDLLLDAIDIVRDKDIPGAARVQALQFIAKLGQLGENAMTKDDGSGRVQINIMIGGKKISFDKEGTDASSNTNNTIEGEVTDVTSEVTA
jgi:hypothetical protein